jgi:peptidoglycan hydrolase-like protein with peptidoglycan-binding domain
VRTIHAILDEVGGVVRWGGDYVGRKDEMHFEIVGNAAAVSAVAVRLRGGGTPAPAPAPAPAPSSGGVLQRGSTGDRVKALQRVLNAWYPSLRLVVDGDFGPATERAVRDMQSRAGLVVDGLAGPATLGRLGL